MITDTPLVSVIMSVYNGEQFLREAINSILQQTFTDFEFIVINDGSTDKTKGILETFHDDRFILIHQNKRGLTKALSRGLSLARGEYIARIDVDDISKPERLEKQVQFLRNNPKIILLGSNCYRLDEEGNVLWTSNLPTEEVYIKWRLLFYNCISHSTVMFRRKEVTALGGYNNNVPYAQDYHLWLRIAKRYPIAILKEPLVWYRMPRKGAISYEKPLAQRQSAEHIQRDVLYSLNPHFSGKQDEIALLGGFIFNNGQIKDIERAEKLFLKLHDSFCNSSFSVNIPTDRLKTVKVEPYIKFAWEYFRRGSIKDFNRCIHTSVECGFAGCFNIPTNELTQKEHALTEALHKYFFTNELDKEKKKRGKSFLSNQYTCLAWQYYSLGDMQNFRRCLLRSFNHCPSIKGLRLLFKSFLGRRVMEAIYLLRTS